MATRKIQTKLELDGEAQYKQAVSEINAGMKALRGEMAKVTAEFEGNADSMEALSKKNDVLERQILTQREKIDTLRAAVAESAEAYGESSKKTMDWQTSLNYAEAELTKMEHQLEANKQAMEKASEATEEGAEKFEELAGESKGLGDVLDTVGDKFGIHLPDSMTKTLNGIAKLDPKLVLLAGGFAAVAGAIATAEEKLKDMTIESAAYADEILTLSNNTGLSTETLQEWSYAAELIDVSLDTVQSSMAKMIRNMSSARDGSGSAKDAFDALGVSITNADGTLRDAETVFYNVIDALGKIENGTERDAISMEIFGKSAQDLNSLIVQGSDTLKAYTDEAHEMGYVLSGESLDALGAVDDAQQRLLKTQEAVTNQISAEYAPYMEKSLTMTRDLIEDIGTALVDSGAVDAFGSILISAQSLLEPLTDLGKTVLPILSTALQGVAGVLAWIADAANVVYGLLSLDFDRVGTALGFNPNQASNMQRYYYGSDYKQSGVSSGSNYWNAETGMYEGNYFHATGTDYFPGGGTWVGENGPEYVRLPEGSQILTAQESRNSERNEFNFYIGDLSIRELEDLLRIVEDARRMSRMKG